MNSRLKKYIDTNRAKIKTPVYLYDQSYLKTRAGILMALELPYGLTVRYAVKANPFLGIVKIFDKLGLHFDASSDYEVDLLLKAGIEASRISLSSQQPARDYLTLSNQGVKLIATSQHQLNLILKAGVKVPIGVRINPGVGHGGNNRTATGGVNSAFGIWHEYIDQVIETTRAAKVTIERIHIHVGSGFDPKVWGEVMDCALDVMRRFPETNILDIGGGYKVARMTDEHDTSMGDVAGVFLDRLKNFNRQTGRGVHLEIEPGSWLVANAGYLLAEVVDVVDTGDDGHNFLRVDTGMNDILRPSLYGAQHPIWVLNQEEEQRNYIVVGHNCESGDILTPAIGDPEGILARKLPKTAIGDLIVIGGAGAYCASMRAVGYNSFPAAEEQLMTIE